MHVVHTLARAEKSLLLPENSTLHKKQIGLRSKKLFTVSSQGNITFCCLDDSLLLKPYRRRLFHKNCDMDGETGKGMDKE